MKALGSKGVTSNPVVRRLGALAALDDDAIAALQDALGRSFAVPVRQELLHEGEPISRSTVMVKGWAARTRCLEDGRRQIINFVLPGDLVGFTGLGQPLASSTVIAITDVTLCPLPEPSASPALRLADCFSRAGSRPRSTASRALRALARAVARSRAG